MFPLALLGLAFAREPEESGGERVEPVEVPRPGLPSIKEEPQQAPIDPTAYTGQRVLLRTLTAPQGGLPEESLEPLLHVQQDRPYNPQDARLDAATLVRVADFAQVEVRVEPWVQPGADGEPELGVWVEYAVYPSPRIERLRVVGNRRLSDELVIRALDRSVGDPVYATDHASMRASVLRVYREAGFPQAKVELRFEAGRSGLWMEVTIEEGPPRRVAELRVRTGDAISQPRARVALAREGLVSGRRYTEASLTEAGDRLTNVLRRRGYYEARVRVRREAVEGGDRLIVLVEPHRRYEVVVTRGRGLPDEDEVTRLLDLEGGIRTTRYFPVEASATLTRSLQAQGYLDALVTVGVEESADTIRLAVTGDRGPVHRLSKVVWTGDSGFSDNYLSGALREASPKVLGDRRVTEEALDGALEELRSFYRSQGYLGVSVRRGPLQAVRAGRDWRGRPRVDREVEIEVQRGALVSLTEVRVVGAEVESDSYFEKLKDEALNPAEIEARARALVEAHRELGYLHADASVRIETLSDGRTARATVTVVPGPVVMLRSILLKGHRRTRRSVLAREVTLKTGEPISSSELAITRRNLYEMDLFNRVSVETVGDEDRIKDLLVEVEEKPNLYFEAGGGVATDEGVRVFGKGGHRNLFGRGHRLSLLGQVGAGWVGESWRPDTVEPEWRAVARYEATDVPNQGEHVALDLLLNEEDQGRYYRLGQSGGAVSVSLRFTPSMTAALSYGLPLRRLIDVDPYLLIEGDPWLAFTESAPGDLALTLPTAFRYTSGPRASVVLDRRDDAFNPRRGTIASVSVDVTDTLLADYAYLRAESNIAAYLPLGALQASVRLRGGVAVVPREGATVPLEDRYHLGGGTTLRGFDLDSVGPANRAYGLDVDLPDAIGPLVDFGRQRASRWVPTGGDTMAMGSVELQIPFELLGLRKWEGWKLATFADAGNVYLRKAGIDADSERLGVDRAFRWAVGLGVRRSTVIGPVQIDLGVNPDPLESRGEGPLDTLLFGLVENPMPVPLRLHVSFGAF